MKRNGIIIILLLITVFRTVGQDINEYIIKGDSALGRLDFNQAKAYYQEVIYLQYCDFHTIEQLTSIWIANESMRSDMTDLMKMCYDCLDNNARLRDTANIKLRITYYKQGIGTNKSEIQAERLMQQLETIRNPNRTTNEQYKKEPLRQKEKMQFFAGYSATLVAPAGLTVGGVGRYVGWFLRVRSNLSFQDFTEACDDAGNIRGLNNGFAKPLGIKKNNTFIGTGGIMVKVAPSFYIAAGAGYCSREALYKFERIGEPVAETINEFWAKCDNKTSFTGVALDLDGTFGITNKIYGAVGLSVLNFMYISANAGIGVFF